MTISVAKNLNIFYLDADACGKINLALIQIYTNHLQTRPGRQLCPFACFANSPQSCAAAQRLTLSDAEHTGLAAGLERRCSNQWAALVLQVKMPQIA
jgi:hypothetical protein